MTYESARNSSSRRAIRYSVGTSAASALALVMTAPAVAQDAGGQAGTNAGAQPENTIIVTGSPTGLNGEGKDFTAYSSSKAGMHGMARAVAAAYATRGIRVNIVEPGFAPGSTASPLTQAHVEATLQQIPLGRATLPNEAPDAVLFLCSSKAAYITGTTLTVDGGNSIGSLAVHQDKKHPG